jgi:23S rRNA (adenine2030-N6)-methyltransferase
MFSYQHAYHAGNTADVLKHAVWGNILTALITKSKPLNVYETHAGRGIYSAAAPETAKLQEYQTGLARLPWPTIAGPLGLAARAYNTGTHASNDLLVIPGSPAVAHTVLRPEDHLHLCEAHPAEYTHLHSWSKSLKTQYENLHLHATNGHQHVPALVRAGQRTAVLVDPSYEMKTEYQTVVDTVVAILKQNPHTTIAVWYPILGVGSKAHGLHQTLIDSLKALNVSATHLSQWRWARVEAGGMVGSGQVVLNLPYGLEDTLGATLKPLSAALNIPHTASTITMIVPRS